MAIEGYKVLTHDYCPPLRGGDPVWDGKRKMLPKVELDTGEKECGAGWNFCKEPHDALRIGGMWPDGYSSVLLRVRGGKDTIERGCKLRSSQLSILEVCSEDEVREAVRVLSELFGEYAEVMVESQMAWWRALARPHWDVATVEASLCTALDARGLPGWKLCRCDTGREVWDRYDRSYTLAARDAWYARAVRAAWAAWDAQDARAAWDTWTARSTVWDVRDAWYALTVQLPSLAGRTEHDPMLLTTGLRDAYGHGLSVAVPVGPRTLGWAMVEKGS
jgi:hypothetical protein